MSMKEYYARRAAEYEKIYLKPERQADLRRMEEIAGDAFPGLSILEVACGTGYWTKFAAASAKSILATDFNDEVLELAKQMDYGTCAVSFQRADAYTLEGVPPWFDAGFHAFWWSHIPKRRIEEFLEAFHSRLATNAPVMMIDNLYVEGSSTPVSRTDENGDTFQTRTLEDGSVYEVLKNFPTPEEIRAQLESHCRNIEIKLLDYCWVAKYRLS